MQSRPGSHGHRFPPEIISHAVWLYHRFTLSFRDVETLLLRMNLEPLTPPSRYFVLAREINFPGLAVSRGQCNRDLTIELMRRGLVGKLLYT